MEPHRKFIDTEINPLRATLFGRTAIEIASVIFESLLQNFRLDGEGM